MNHPPLHCVRPNYIEASSQAWKLAQQHSAGKIGYVLVIEEDDEWHSRDLAACLLFKNYAPGRERMVPPLILRPADYLPLGPWLSQHNPDLIVTNNPGTHWALVELKIRVPDEVQIIGLNIYERDFMSGFRLLNQEMGVAAMHILDSLVRLGERGIPVYRQTHLMELLWNPGTTLRTTARK
ncbi:MAG: hypothetical protein SFY80_02030 [Verrucomicrobiota bacterium]|nr:hypothetical protein [Verrucomicrobiota bacterium]